MNAFSLVLMCVRTRWKGCDIYLRNGAVHSEEAMIDRYEAGNPHLLFQEKLQQLHPVSCPQPPAHFDQSTLSHSRSSRHGSSFIYFV